MQMEIPIFRQIWRDGALPPRAFQVWKAAIEMLDLLEYRRLKLSSIENALEIDASTVSRALTTLVERGYLDRKEGEYRVPFSRSDYTGEVQDPQQLEINVVASPTRRTKPRVHSSGVL
jgi:predicted transcriptional regulator